MQSAKVLNLLIFQRNISTSSVCNGKRNFRKFLLYNKRGSRSFKEAQRNGTCSIPVDKRGVRDTGLVMNGKYIEIPEKIPELIVPDLTDCDLRPYVSYRAPDVIQSEFTSLDLFNAVYTKKIMADYEAGKLAEDGSPIEPSEDESLTPSKAWENARKTGSDIF